MHGSGTTAYLRKHSERMPEILEILRLNGRFTHLDEDLFDIQFLRQV